MRTRWETAGRGDGAVERADAILRRMDINLGAPPRRGGAEVGSQPMAKTVHPPMTLIFRARRMMGTALLLLGVVEFVAHWFLPLNGSVLATQTPVGRDSVGRVRQTPESLTVSRIYPQLNIAIGTFIAGLMVLSTEWRTVAVIFASQCQQSLLYFVHIQACFQSMILIITVLPLAGVVNVYELVMAAMLTVAQYSIMLFSDMSNQMQLSHWDTVDIYRGSRDEPPAQAFMNAGVHMRPVLEFHWMPLMLMLFIFVSVWAVIYLHLADAMHSDTYSIEADFVFIVIFTGIAQAIIPIVKVMQFARPWILVSRSLCTYRAIMFAIDIMEFVNMAVVGVALMFAYGTINH